MCTFSLGIFVDYTVVEFNYQCIIEITNLPKHAVKSTSTNKFSSFPQQPVYLIIYFLLREFFFKAKRYLCISHIKCVQVNQTTQLHISVIQDKMKSVGFPVAIQSIRISSKVITMTGEKADDQAQPGHTKGDIFICGRAIKFVFCFYELQA